MSVVGLRAERLGDCSLWTTKESGLEFTPLGWFETVWEIVLFLIETVILIH